MAQDGRRAARNRKGVSMNEPDASNATIEIGLSSWIIQDGNYGDFHVGDRAEFAVEFYPDSVNKAASASPALLERIAPAQYNAAGRILHLTSELWVLDLGLLVFQESRPPKGLSVGDSIAGAFHLGIDPFFYFESLYASAAIPPMIYTWCIHRILIETAPFVESTEGNARGGPKVYVRDPLKRGRREIAATNAWNDDDGHADYVLVCELLDIPPKRHRSVDLWPR